MMRIVAHRRQGWTVGLLAATALFGSLLAFAPRAAAHSDAPAQRTIAIAPRAEARIGNQEVVITYVGGAIALFLHRYIDGVPTSGAELEITVDFMPASLSEIAPGVYRSEPLSLAGGNNEIELAYVIGEQEGSEVIPLTVATNGKVTTTRSTPAPTNGSVPGPALAMIAVLLFAGVNFLLFRRARRA
jgi:hypothetical protein